MFWAATGVVILFMLSDVSACFQSKVGVGLLTAWTLPAGYYIWSSRRVKQTEAAWQHLKGLAAGKALTEFCGHDARCQCRQSFVRDLADRGIQLFP